MSDLNPLSVIEVEKIQKDINARIRDNNPGIVARNVPVETWKLLEIQLDIRHAHGLNWNLYTNVKDYIDITVAPSGTFNMIPSYPMGDSVEDDDGWSYGSMCMYAC